MIKNEENTTEAITLRAIQAAFCLRNGHSWAPARPWLSLSEETSAICDLCGAEISLDELIRQIQNKEYPPRIDHVRPNRHFPPTTS